VRAASTAADGTPLYDDNVCVDGAMFVFGSKDAFGLGEADGVPRRVAVVPPFRIDRYEVTVGRFRAAVARGLELPPASQKALGYTDKPLATEATDATYSGMCTFSKAPLGRESYPLNCVDWGLARAFCKFDGGDLPTEAQWEYVAANAGRPFQTRFPWGGDDRIVLRCERTVFGRGPFPFNNDCNQDGKQFGVLPVGSRPGASGDVSARLGVVDLAGSLSEFMVDAFASLSSNCWASQPLVGPACEVEGASTHTARGGNWSTSRQSMYIAFRGPFPSVGVAAGVGFRCVHPGT
jgi:formylglycine-generating enzyme required for sulfatase activity